MGCNMTNSRLQALHASTEQLRNILEELDQIEQACMSQQDRSALIDWMVVEQTESLTENIYEAYRQLLYSGVKGLRDTCDFDLLEEYIFSVGGVPDSDFDGFGQLKRCEKIITDKIAELMLLHTAQKTIG